MQKHTSSYTDPKEGFKDYHKGIVVISFTKDGGFLFATPILTEQKDVIDKGRWSSYVKVLADDYITFIYNQVGVSNKKAKASVPNSPYNLTEQTDLSTKGTAIAKPIVFATKLANTSLVATVYLNNAKNTYIILENAAKDEYVLGKLTPIKPE